MKRIGHVDALPPIMFDGVVDNVPCLRMDSGLIQHLNQRRSDPLRDIRPALFAHHFRDLAAVSHAPDIG